MSIKPTITVIGSLNIDFVTLTSRVPGPGETLTAKALQVNAGGKGANQGVAAGKASFQTESTQDVSVHMIGSVGRDDPYYASLLKPTLERSGVKTSGISEIENSQTGTATILVEETGQNRILFVPGANYDGMSDCTALIGKLPKTDVVVMQGEIPRSTTLKLLDHFGSSPESTVVLNPAPVFNEGIPKEALSKVDILIVNEPECLLLASHMEHMSIQVEDEDNISVTELENIAAAFHSHVGIQEVLITLGARGVFCSKKDGKQDMIPAANVDKVVDTTAAGDTFVGYLAVALARHQGSGGKLSNFNISAAAKRANAAAALCVQRTGAMASIPFNYEIQ
jgi:ribokinase